MIPDLVVDIGNTRIKWGLCADDGSAILRTASLVDDAATWDLQLANWCSSTSLASRTRLTWVIAGVQPKRSERLIQWIEARQDGVVVLSRAAQLPLVVGLQHPDRAGIDRLLNAVAAKRHLEPDRGAVLIDAGSAVTIDWLDENHVFQGGCISPGLDLMAEALHRYTALLPRVQVTAPLPALPAGSTIPAMQVGVFLAVSGGIREAVRLYTAQAKVSPRIFFSGGQAPLLAEGMGLHGTDLPAPWTDYYLWPEQTLMGILMSAENLP